MSCCGGKNKSCGKGCCKTKAKFKADWRYCGEELDCIGVEKGDSITTILEKINESSCQEDGDTYSFQEKEDCENGGFEVFRGDLKIFEQCYPCCGDSCKGLHVSDYSIEKVEDEEHITHTHNIEVEGGSGDYEFSVTPMIFTKLLESEYEININTDTGEIEVKMQRHSELPGLLDDLRGFFNITIKDKVTGCVIQYSIFDWISR